MVVPNNHWLSYKKWSFCDVKWGYHHLRKHPYLHGVFQHHQPSQPSTPINGFHNASSPSSGSWSNRQYSLVPWQPKHMTTTCVWYVCEKEKHTNTQQKHGSLAKSLWGCWKIGWFLVSPYLETMTKKTKNQTNSVHFIFMPIAFKSIYPFAHSHGQWKINLNI